MIQVASCFLLKVYIVFACFHFFGHAQPQVPCYFIFGDSLIDNGNNNLLTTEAKANYFPYGIDYPTGQSGRFTNGRNIADFIAKYLGFRQPIPANAYARGPAILKGVNYGSGASGIREETGNQQGDRISLDRQLQNHKRVVSDFGTLLRGNATKYLQTCLYSVGMGSNDYLNNYLISEQYNTSMEFNSDQYAQALIQQYSQQLKTLYSYGARKIVVFGIGLIGCIPLVIDASGCSTKANTNGLLFDTMLPPLINSLNQNFTDARFIFINVTHISLTPVPNTGITVQGSPCCNVSTTVSLGQCQRNTNPCRNRTSYTFFDDFHPSEHAAELLAQRSYRESSEHQLRGTSQKHRRLQENSSKHKTERLKRLINKPIIAFQFLVRNKFLEAEDVTHYTRLLSLEEQMNPNVNKIMHTTLNLFL